MIVKYTEYGASLLTTGVDVVEEEDATIRQILGDERAEIVREALIELLDHLDPEGF